MRKVNYNRLSSWIEQLSRIGATPEGGVRRLAASDEDRDGRNLVLSWMKDLGLEIAVDQIGNIFATLRGESDSAPIMIGSHIDSVGNAGSLDGPYGVLAGLEIVASFKDVGILPSIPICVAIFTNEEGVRFQPDMMGSLVHAGGMELESALATTDRTGKSLGDELARIGYAGPVRCGSIKPRCFIELHIEQGPILENEGITIGVVEGVQGIYWTEVEFRGQANHAGTTPMHLRRDAGLAAMSLATEVKRITDSIPNQVGTVGSITLKPNLINVVPGWSQITIDLRNRDGDKLHDAQLRFEAAIELVQEKENVSATVTPLVRFEPVEFDHNLVAIVECAAQSLQHSNRRIVSGAGHDAQMMARVCPAAMIFVPSVNGVSHNPAEATNEEDLYAGLDVLSKVIESILKDASS
ncbi:MAG: Zn-dependent hydrolase [Parvibaculaceae bacterium]